MEKVAAEVELEVEEEAEAEVTAERTHPPRVDPQHQARLLLLLLPKPQPPRDAALRRPTQRLQHLQRDAANARSGPRVLWTMTFPTNS